MKKNFLYAMMGAIALTGAVNFSACQSSDEIDVNPTFDGNAVKTSFTISIGDVKGTSTRMVNDAVQADEAFQGMTDIYLFPFTSAVAEDVDINESYIHLADITGFNTNLEAANGKIYNDVNLSVGVNHFLFYGVTRVPGNGKLKASYLEMKDETNWATGFTTWAPSPIVKGTTAVKDLTFDLVPIRRGWTIGMVSENEKAIATIKPLNDADAALNSAIEGITGTTDPEKAAKKALEDIQKTLRNELTTGTYTAYAGSSASVKSLMEMLYATLKNLAGSTLKTGETTSYGDDIMTAIETSFTATENATTGEWTLAWKTDPGFPANLGVPDGAAAVMYTGTADGPFEFVTTSVEGLEVPAISNYTYPASLYYTVNTSAMTRETEYLDQAENSTKAWSAIATSTNYPGAVVTAATRSVIMKDQVQYAVGRLDVAVRVKPETIINDNSKSVASDGTISNNPQPVSVPTNGYKLTGVLIGGQKQVGWDFTPIGTTEMTIWDKVMAGTIYAKQQKDFSSPNYTLALETAANTPINIALEFENTGNDFCGIDHNLIPAGTKFYLVANLNPKATDDGGNWTATGETGLNQVFKQDYITTANLTIGENSLKSAYNVVPDLRSPKLEFGLSVDLHWRTGLTFDVEL